MQNAIITHPLSCSSGKNKTYDRTPHAIVTDAGVITAIFRAGTKSLQFTNRNAEKYRRPGLAFPILPARGTVARCL